MSILKKLDATPKSALQDQVNTATLASLDARDAAVDAAAAPLNSQLEQQAAELAEECNKLRAAARRSTAIPEYPNAVCNKRCTHFPGIN